MTIPYVNSTLTAITAPGTAGDYDVPPAPGADRWTGAIGIYVADEPFEADSPGRVDVLVKTRLELPYNIGNVVQRGDSLTFTFAGASQTRVAKDLLKEPLVGRVRVLLVDG